MPYERLDRENGLHYPCPTEDHPGTLYLHDRFHTTEFTSEKTSFVPVSYTAPLELPDEEYPFTLTTGRRYESYNTHTQTKFYADGVKIKQTEETIDMHPDDAVKIGVDDGELVKVSSRRGSVKVKTKLTNKMVPGLVFMSFHWSEVPTNMLTLNEYDPISGTAEFKSCAIKIEKIT
ncbi:molybdopterin dinucleotide binding domain-containing protein [Cytobacillus sp. IB215316]|nr:MULTISPECIES: molybdopterin dinucleotide binding domain-containing protein [Bacillaceae]MDX8361941.1 molybdopterin dinucleotide binding domain-containing protein [Cytobacillus sp. IB215316]